MPHDRATDPTLAPPAPAVPAPTVMPVDREAWGRKLDLCNFVNAYYQYRDLQYCGTGRRVLLVGPGQGLDTQVLRWRGYDVVTFDIDDTFRPDILGSVHEMTMFADGEFDTVIASHVVEHLAVPYLDRTLAEIARVGRHALIYLPATGRHAQFRFKPGFKGIDLSLELDVYNPVHRPDGVTPRYCQRQHFWEVGMRGFRPRDVLRRMSPHFEPIEVYRNRDWIESYNFVLRSRRHAARS
jgi:hypothetical protein